MNINNTPDRDVWNKWKDLVNMTYNELKTFVKTEDGKTAGLSRVRAKELNIKSGQESAMWLLKMIPTGKTYNQAVENWTPNMWQWARRQVRFNSRMRGNRGPLYKDNIRTRKHKALLIWGHDPIKYKR